MSKEKFYAVKNDKGEWADSLYTFGSGAWATPNKAEREAGAHAYGGHIVALVEEPEKVVLSKEQAKIVEEAKTSTYPATYISETTAIKASGDEKLLMAAFTNGYTVAKDNKYRVIAPKSWDDTSVYLLIDINGGIGLTDDRNNPRTLFTKKQLDLYDLNGGSFKREKVTDNA